MFQREHSALRVFRWSEPVFLRKYIALRFFRWSELVFLREHTALVGTSVSKKARSAVFFFQVV